jgi:hypothetical protein
VERSPDHFDVVAGRGFFRPIGCVSLKDAAELITAAIAYARANGIRELMVNASSLTGVSSPSLGERYFMAQKWAHAADGAVRVAIVVRPDMIDPQKFGVTVAVNRRLTLDVFESEVAAVAWLDKGDPPSDPTATQIRAHAKELKRSE